MENQILEQLEEGDAIVDIPNEEEYIKLFREIEKYHTVYVPTPGDFVTYPRIVYTTYTHSPLVCGGTLTWPLKRAFTYEQVMAAYEEVTIPKDWKGSLSEQFEQKVRSYGKENAEPRMDS